MRKEIYLIKGLSNESYRQFSDRILSVGAKLLLNKDLVQIRISYTSDPPPKISVIPFKSEKIAAVSIYSTSEVPAILLNNEPGFSGGYRVEEAIPVAYEKKWDDGTITPGICLLTLFNRKPGIDTKTFIDRWHNSHTPLSLEIHPLWHYNRNVVLGKISGKSAHWEGIVEEHCQSRAELLNPAKFFGPPLKMVYNMLRVYFDTRSFLDYKTIETYLATEIWIKS